MKRLFVLFVFVLYTFNIYAQQTQLPTLKAWNGVSEFNAVFSDTAQEGKSLRLFMNTMRDTISRFTKWDYQLTNSFNFTSGSRISLNLMVPNWSGDIQVSVSLLQDTTVVVNSPLVLVSRGAYHRQLFIFPALSGNINKVRINLSYLSGDKGSRALFIDGIYMVTSGVETLLDNCNGPSGGITILAPTLALPLSNATNISLNTLLSCNAAANATTYEFNIIDSVATTVAFDTTVSSTQVSAKHLLPGKVYKWQARGKNGAVIGSWSAFRKFTTIVDTVTTLAMPTQKSPANRAKNLLPNLQVAYDSVARATNYEVLVIDSISTATVYNQTVTTLAASLTLPLGKTYLWKVRAKHAQVVSAWSPIWSFSVSSDTTTAPAQVVLKTPTDAAFGISTLADLSWNSAARAVKYIVHIEVLFGALVKNDTVTTLNTRIQLAPSTQYLWKVAGISATGKIGSWSAPWIFTTGMGVITPTIPHIVDPSANAEIQLPYKFKWNKAVGSSARLQFMTLNGVIEIDTLCTTSDTTFTLALGKLPSGWHIFRMKMISGSLSSDWSIAIQFYVKPEVVTLTAPVFTFPSAQNMTGVSTNPTICWSQVTGASLYEFQLSLNSTFTDITYTTSVSVLSQQISLKPATTYYLRIRAIDAASKPGGWSVTYSFITVGTTDVEKDSGIPTEFLLSQNYPNPFNPTTNIRFEIPEQSHVILKVYDVVGREVAMLVNETLPAGKFTRSFNGVSLSSGIYIYRLQAGKFSKSSKMILTK